MEDDMTVFRGDFNRKENWAECDGVRFVSKQDGSDTIYTLCRSLVEAGHEDGSMQLFDERGMHCLTIHSIHRAATKMLTGIQLTEYVSGDAVVKSDAKPAKPETVTSTIYGYLSLVADGKWRKLHGKTKNTMLRNEFATANGKLTAKGETAIADYAAAHPPKPVKEYVARRREFTEDQRAAIGARMKASWEARQPTKTNTVPTVFKVNNLLITIKQREALDIIINRPRKLTDIHGKTMNKLIEFGLMDNTGSRPMLTNAGRDAAKVLGVLASKAA
jgi:hypothetical protein